MGAAGLALGLGVARGFGALSAGQSQAGILEQQATSAVQLAELDRQVAERNIAIERARSAEEQELAKTDAQRSLAQTQAAFGASGVEFSGTPLDVLSDQVITLAHQRRKLRTESATRQQAIKFQGELSAFNKLQQASLLRRQASTAKTRGLFGFGTSLLGGAFDFSRLGGEFGDLF